MIIKKLRVYILRFAMCVFKMAHSVHWHA